MSKLNLALILFLLTTANNLDLSSRIYFGKSEDASPVGSSYLTNFSTPSSPTPLKMVLSKSITNIYN